MAIGTPPPSVTEQRNVMPAPRAFARGTGLVLQVTGSVLFVSTCVICSLAGLWKKVLSRGEWLEKQHHYQSLDWSVVDLVHKPADAGMMLMAMFMTIGGLALLVFGLGLQFDKRHAAAGALTTSTAALIVLTLAGIGVWVDDGSWLARLWHALLSLVVLVLTPLTVAAVRQVRAHPPPEDLYVVSDDFDVDRYKRSLRFGKPRTPQELAKRRAALDAELRELDRMEQQRQHEP